jgi:hypothetical protein
MLHLSTRRNCSDNRDHLWDRKVEPSSLAVCKKDDSIDIMCIITMVSNWSRQTPLEETLRSCATMLVGIFEPMATASASIDGSREVIKRCRAELQNLETIFLDENFGDEAINLALERLNGDLIHNSANDQVYSLMSGRSTSATPSPFSSASGSSPCMARRAAGANHDDLS